MDNDLKKMPKVELHLHLDGSLSLDLASELSGLSKEELVEKMVAPDKCQNLSDYLTKFDFPISLMQTKKNLSMIAYDLVNRLEEDEVIYAEIRFAPMFHTKEGLTMEEVVEAVLNGLRQNKRVQSNLILCMMRGASLEDNQKTLLLAEEYLNRGVCAVDLAGAEDKYPIDDYLPLFDEARKKGIPFTIHAGENGGADEVRRAILAGASRIGHGIHALDDEKVLSFIKEKNILLEICPTSNVQTNAVLDYAHHPIFKFYQMGILFNLNTDNSCVSHISLNEEYLKVNHYFSFLYEDYVKMNLDAIAASFLSLDDKKNLVKKFYDNIHK